MPLPLDPSIGGLYKTQNLDTTQIAAAFCCRTPLPRHDTNRHRLSPPPDAGR
jgi:hypothetical protein